MLNLYSSLRKKSINLISTGSNVTELDRLKSGTFVKIKGAFSAQFRYINMFIDIAKRLGNKSYSFLSIIVAHAIKYRAPANLNYFYSFGFLLAIYFALQLITGISLAMYYKSNAAEAFDSVRFIMTDVKYGYIFRYMHSNGASMIFLLMFIHIGRGLFYRSYLYQRSWVWWSGILIFLIMMATAFIGYVLPWGQMSYWGATVITNLFSSIPVYGPALVSWIWGGFSVNPATLSRFYSLHYLLPFVIAALILTHIALLHQVGSSNPTGLPSEKAIDFSPAYLYKDFFLFALSGIFFFYLVFFEPNLLGHPDNFIKANPLVTPAHIVPEWYFTPFYAILRAFPNKVFGILAMGASILVLFILPFYKKLYTEVPETISLVFQGVTFIFFLVFFGLMFLGMQPVAESYVISSQILTVLYFMYFCVFLPLYSYFSSEYYKK